MSPGREGMGEDLQQCTDEDHRRFCGVWFLWRHCSIGYKIDWQFFTFVGFFVNGVRSGRLC